jgi:hypothetical protein
MSTIGQSAANVAARKAGKKLIDAYRRIVGLPADVTLEEIEGGKLKSGTASICFWLVERVIPYGGFDEKYNPPTKIAIGALFVPANC